MNFSVLSDNAPLSFHFSFNARSVSRRIIDTCRTVAAGAGLLPGLFLPMEVFFLDCQRGLELSSSCLFLRRQDFD